jgi:hypothetical protein
MSSASAASAAHPATSAKVEGNSLRIPAAASDLVTRVSKLKRAHSPEREAAVSTDPNSWAGRMKRMSPQKAEAVKQKAAAMESKMVDEPAPASSSSVASMSIPASASVEAQAALKLFFLGMVRGVSAESVRDMVAASWSSHPELTLQILQQARDCRSGKGEKSVVLEGLLWLRAHKPRTYCRNVLEFLRLGYFKDLLQIAAAAKDRRLPMLGLSGDVPLEIEILAEFLRADQEALSAFQKKQEERKVEEVGEGIKGVRMEDVPKADTASSPPATASATVAPASDDFEMLVAPSSSSSSIVKQDLSTFAVIPRATLKIDLCFVIDSTGSMGPWLEQVKASVKQLVEQMGVEGSRSGVAQVKIRLALLAYQDYFDTNRYDRQDFTDDVDAFLAVVRKLTPRGGADLPEDLVGGLKEAMEYSWDPQADTRMLLLIADAPCHGKQFSPYDSDQSLKHLAAHPEDPEALVREIAKRDIHFSFTRITPSTDVMLEAFQGWFDDRRSRKVMNVLQLGQRVQRFLPLVMEQLTLAALGRMPTIEAPEDEEEVAPTVPSVEEENKQQDDSSAPREAKRPKRKPAGSTCALSLAGKWTPTERSHFDQAPYKFASGLARLLFPGSKGAAKQYRVLCSALRDQLHVVERLMCTQQWAAIDFAVVPARCHHLMKKVFAKRQTERYAAFMGRVKRGEVTIKTAGLQPHELTETYRSMRHPLKVDETVEAQWKTIVEKLRKEMGDGHHANALAIVDTSGSMTWNLQLGAHGPAANVDNKMSSVAPIDAAIALGLLVSQLTTGPFKDRILTFSEQPRWLQLPPSDSATLCDRVDAVYSQAESGGSTNLVASLELILDVASSSRCAPTDLPTALFVLSDMDLNSNVGAALNLVDMKAQFAEAGYAMPEIVLWNLAARAAGETAPTSASIDSQLVAGVTLGESGVAFISGYSPALIKLVLKQELRLEPMTILVEAVQPYTRVEIEEEER